jgi:nucleoid-associated protein YgaU
MSAASLTPSISSLLQFAGVLPSLFAPNSRYLGIPTSTLTTADGRTVAYVQRRFVPQPEQLAQVQQHKVTQGERLDVIAAQYLGDPELFWRIADANRAMRAEDLTAVVGVVLRICLPQGIPGMQSA